MTEPVVSRGMLPRTPRDFVNWCKKSGYESVLVGTVQHDIRNIKAIANKYGYDWDENRTRAGNISSTAIALDDFFRVDSEPIEIGEMPVEIPKKATKLKVVEPTTAKGTNWGSW